MFDLGWRQWLVVISILMALFGTIPYIKDTLKGKTKPNRVSWLMWSVAPLIGVGAALSAGAEFWPMLRILFTGIMPLIVFIVTFMAPKAYWKLEVFDYLCGFCSVVAILIWLVIDEPVLAILVAATADGFAFAPTIKKAWTNPETETLSLYVVGAASMLLIFPSIPELSIENLAFPVYLLIGHITMISIIKVRR